MKMSHHGRLMLDSRYQFDTLTQLPHATFGGRMFRSLHWFCIALFALLLPPARGAAQSFRLGVNLDAAGAFIDVVRGTSRYSNVTAYDSLGWPESDFDLVLMDGRPAREWAGTIDDPEHYRIDYSGRYACGFRGSADVRATGTSVAVENFAHDAASNATTFDLVVGGWPEANHGLVFLTFTNTRRSATDTLRSGITDLRVHRPGYPLGTNRVFTDEYLALCTAADFACYRFYNVQNIWDGEPAWPQRITWEQRKTPRDAAQVSMAQTTGKRDGWCWEYIVQLANILRKDIWINIHLSCDSLYVARLAAMLQRDLDPAINVYVESSNEVWSPTQATHGPYNQADALARGITFDQNHARRTVELSNWFATVFGRDAINTRIRVILAGQHAYGGRSDAHLDFINSRFGPPRAFIYATSTALYFESQQATSTDPVLVASGFLADITEQISDPQAATWRPAHIGKAVNWGLPGGCTSYEGGPSTPSGGGTANLGAQILAHRTPVMANAIERSYLDGWRELGGGLALYFTLASGYNRYGCWGLTDDPSQPDRNFKMQAIRNILGTPTAADRPPVPSGNSISVYPNPATTSLTIRSDVPAHVRITDVLGREMWRGDIGRSSTIGTIQWPAGMYFVHAPACTVRVVKR
jgi:hypothetical protein